MGAFVADAHVPAGNIVVDAVDGDQIAVHQDIRDTEGDWFYWKFRVAGAAGRNLRVRFTQSQVIGTRGPAVSVDKGDSWRWLGTERVEDWRAFAYDVPAGVDEVWFCFCIPYLQRDLDLWLAKRGARSRLRRETLCRSRQGREVELLHVPAARPKFGVFLTCRHHCCEAMANYALEGFLAAALADDAFGRWYAEEIDIHAVPFVDKDGVENGDQGKNRRPRDHGRDYLDESIYPEPAAIRRFFADHLRNLPVIAMDLHCPWIRGEYNEVIYQVGREEEATWRKQQRFGSILEECRRGPIPYQASDDLPFGVAWNTNANYAGGRGFTRWSATLPNVAFATSFEIPYANHGDLTLTPEMVRAFGADLAEAVRRYLIKSA